MEARATAHIWSDVSALAQVEQALQCGSGSRVALSVSRLGVARCSSSIHSLAVLSLAPTAMAPDVEETWRAATTNALFTVETDFPSARPIAENASPFITRS